MTEEQLKKLALLEARVQWIICVLSDLFPSLNFTEKFEQMENKYRKEIFKEELGDK